MLFGIFFALIGIAAFVFGLKSFGDKKLIENVPTSKIRSLAMGLVEVYGTIVPFEKVVLSSPFTNKDCVYYDYKIEEERGSGKNRHWVTIKHETKMQNFFVRDETAQVVVDPRGAKMDVPESFYFGSGMFKDPPVEVKNFLAANSLGFEGWFGINRSMRFVEHALFLDQKVFVMGEAMDNPLVEEGTAKAGIEDVIIGKGQNEKFFLISNKSEKDVLKNMSFAAYGGVIVGILLVALGLFLLFVAP